MNKIYDYLNKIIKRINAIINKNNIKKIKKTTNIINKEIIEENKTISNETVEEKKVIKNLNINWELINQLKDNDIVFVKMKDEEIMSREINETHQKRPFLIIEKNEELENITGYYLTSNIEKNNYIKKKYKNLKVILNERKYELEKSSLILYEEKIKLPYENVIRYVDYIKDDDLNKLKKYKKILRKKK